MIGVVKDFNFRSVHDEVLPFAFYRINENFAQVPAPNRPFQQRILTVNISGKDVQGTIAQTRTFADFDTFWKIALTGPRVAPRVAAMAPADVELLKSRLRARLAADATGRITYGARANAVKGRKAEA